jgi:hypothetical protein
MVTGINKDQQQQSKTTTTIGQQIDANSAAIEGIFDFFFMIIFTQINSAELTSGLLAQFGFSVPSKEAAMELSRQLSGMLGTFPPEWLNNLQAQQQANIMQQSHQQQTRMMEEASVVAMASEANAASCGTIEAANNNANTIAESSEQSSQNTLRRNSEIMRRKSGWLL